MLGSFRLNKSLDRFSKRKQDEPQQLSGILGLTSKVVQVPNREGYVYVRLRDNQNEVITAFNDAVAPVFGLPVIVEWDVTRYVVIGRDLERYALWGTSAPYLPLHGGTHSFSEWGQGGDVVWVYGRQFMPLLAVPSGSNAGQNAIVYPYTYSYDDTWKYLGITGTPSLVSSLPTGGSNARMGLLYLDRRNNILGVDFSGEEFLATITGTAEILQYLPQPSSIHYLPVAGVRVVTGTSTIGWQNLYDVRPFFGGAGGGGGSLIGFTDGSVIFAEDEQAAEDNDNFFYDNANDALLLRDNTSTLVDSTTFLRVLANTSIGQIIASAGTSVLSYFGLYRARGTKESPTAVQSGDILGRIYFNGHDGTGWQSKARWDAKTTENWSGTNRGTEIEVRTTPIAGADTQKVGSWKGYGLELVKSLQTGQLVTVTGSYVTDQEDCIILANWIGASGTSQNITLHHPTYQSQVLYIKRIDDPDYSTVDIDAGDGDTIDGAASISLSNQYETVILIANGTATWEIFSSSVEIANPDTITEDTTNLVAGGVHTHAAVFTDLEVDSLAANGDGNKTKLRAIGAVGQTANLVQLESRDYSGISGFGKAGALFLGADDAQVLVAATQINPDLGYAKLNSASDVTLTSNPQIENGDNDGQELRIQYMGSNSVTLVNGQGIVLRSASYTMYLYDWIVFMWDDDNELWQEINRSSPTSEQTWAFKSFHLSGSAGTPGISYALGFYRHAVGAATFNPAKTFGYNLVAHGVKVYLVLGQNAVDELTIRISGAQVQSDGSVSPGQAEDIVISAGAVTNDYFETTTYWVGEVTLTYISGTEKPCNYGFVRYWNNGNNYFRVVGLYATWFSAVTDNTSDLRLYHHKAQGWSANTGSIAAPPAFVAGMQDDYGNYDRAIQWEYGAWERNNLNTFISGSSEGLIVMIRSEDENTFELGNFSLRYRPAW